MGTRRSRHNKGRKPLYKEHRRYLIEDEVKPVRERLSRRTRGKDGTASDDPSASRIRPDAFLLSEAARRLTRSEVANLSEEEAFALFTNIRWPGGPLCPVCSCDSFYLLATRKRFRCAKCEHQFTPTGGTIFASRKLSYRSILVSIATFLKNDDRQTIEQRAEIIGCNPRTAYSLTSRFRQATQAAGIEIQIGHSRYGGYWLSTGAHWSTEEKEALTRFAAMKAALSDAADALGRSPTSLLGYSRELNIKVPLLWRPPRQGSGPRAILQYPYVSEARPQHADLLEVNNLVPKAFGGDMRADICQEVMLALFEGRTSIDELRANRDQLQFFVRKFWRDNFEQSGHSVSLHDDDGSRSFDEIASSIAAREWNEAEMNDARNSHDAMRTFYAPTQVDDLFEEQVLDHKTRMHMHGLHVNFAEARLALDAGEHFDSDAAEIAFARMQGSSRARVRADLWAKQKGRCCYCKSITRLPEHAGPSWLPVATLEHRVALKHGGGRYDRNNLAMSCEPCNSTKGHATEIEFISQSLPQPVARRILQSLEAAA